MVLTYPATLSDLRGRVQDRLLVTANAKGHWTDAKIRNALNRAQVELQLEILQVFEDRYFVREETFLDPSNGVIALPADHLRIVTFEKMIAGIGDRNWRQVTISKASQVQEHRYATPQLYQSDLNNLTQEVWIQVGDRLESQYPAVTGTYKLRDNYRIPDLQDDADASEIPPSYHDVLTDSACWRLSKDAKDDAQAARMREDYQHGLSLMKRTVGRTNPTAEHRIRRTYGGSGRRSSIF